MNEIQKTIRSLKKAGFLVEINDFWKHIEVKHGAFPSTWVQVSFNDLVIEKIGLSGCIERFMEEVDQDAHARGMDAMSWG